MSQGCNTIIADILKNCENLVAGIKDELVFINVDDIDKDSCTFDADNPLLLTSLVLKDSSPELSAYRFQGYNYSNEHKATLVKKTYSKTWEHNLVFRLFDNTPEDKLWIHNAQDSRFVAIIKNNYNKEDADLGDGRTVYEVLGWDFGLEINAAERDANSDELQGGWLLTAGCHDKLKEPLPPLTYWVSDLATTELAIEALFTA